jgi:hypothetical protein
MKDDPDPQTPSAVAAAPARSHVRPQARPAGPLGERLEAALRKAYAHDDLRLHGVAGVIVQALVHRGLALAAPRGNYERHVLSPEGERRAAELTRAILVRRGQSAAPASPPEDPGLDGPVSVRAAWCDRLVDFLTGETGAEATTLVADLPSAGPGGESFRRVRVERCGPTKFLIQVGKTRTSSEPADPDSPSTISCTTSNAPKLRPI